MIRWFRSYIFLIATLVFIADRISKYVVMNSLAINDSIKAIPGIFHITLIMNSGAAFGVLKNCAAFFIIFSFLAIALIILFVAKSPGMNIALATSLAFILGGAAGNLVDRLKFSGCVVDFLDFRIWPVFNIADSAISIGIALLAVTLILKRS